jgi:isopenicillin N synthase-like dioxygenase
MSLELPIINLLVYLQNPESQEAKAECLKAASSMELYSAFAIKDHRISEQDNSNFIDLQEDYFSQPLSDKMKDVRPQFHYQV